MSFNEITINTDILMSDIESLQTLLTDIRSQLDSMFTSMQQLDAMWDGPANDEFNRQFSLDYANTLELCTTIESIIECMEFSRKSYHSCEDEVNDIIKTINV